MHSQLLLGQYGPSKRSDELNCGNENGGGGTLEDPRDLLLLGFFEGTTKFPMNESLRGHLERSTCPPMEGSEDFRGAESI